jgi:hypothetical protein
MDIQLINHELAKAKELIQSVMEELRHPAGRDRAEALGDQG